MSDLLEHLLDLALDRRERRHRQHETELGIREEAIRGRHAELERRRTRFSTQVRSLIQKAVEQANRHLMRRPERCEFREVSRYATGPWHPGGPLCDPIAYEFLSDGQEVDGVLIVELTHDGMVVALLGPLHTHQVILPIQRQPALDGIRFRYFHSTKRRLPNCSSRTSLQSPSGGRLIGRVLIGCHRKASALLRQRMPDRLRSPGS